MTALITSIGAQLSGFTGKLHTTVKSHVLTVVYLAVLAVIIIPIASHIWRYWEPVVSAYKPAFSSEQPKVKGKL